MPRIALVCVLGLPTLLGCTRNNKEFCCATHEDCASVGVDDDKRECGEGLACVDHSCSVPTCATAGCGVARPVCDIATDVCSVCSKSSDCARFPATTHCDPASGSCVGCLAPTDCPDASPVCDQQQCRLCRVDSECASGACAENGTCVPEIEIVYIAPTGVDSVPCSRAQPCISLQFARNQTSATRTHIVLAPGMYTPPPTTFANQTTAPFIGIHGGGATLSIASQDGFLQLLMPSLLSNITLVNTAGNALFILSTVTVKDVTVRGGTTSSSNVMSNGNVTMEDVQVQGAGCAVGLNGGSLTVKRAVVKGGTNGICTYAPSVVNIENLLVSDTTDVGLDIPGVIGTISFSTIAQTGGAGSGVAGIRCSSSGLTLKSLIVSTPNAPSRPTVEGACIVQSSIVTPTAVPGAMNVDPVFVSIPTGNFHISGGSPAKDAVNTGPPFDFEGDVRPKGTRFDLGADEAP